MSDTTPDPVQPGTSAYDHGPYAAPPALPVPSVPPAPPVPAAAEPATNEAAAPALVAPFVASPDPFAGGPAPTDPAGTYPAGTYPTDPHGSYATDPYGAYAAGTQPTVELPTSGPMDALFGPPVAVGTAGEAGAAGAVTPGAEAPAKARGGRTLALVLATALVASGVGGGVGALVASNHDNGTTSSSLSTDASNNQASVVLPTGSVEAVAAKVLPSVVSIVERSTDGSGGEGSGIILSSDGLILTNNHVVVGAAAGGTLQVTTQDGKTVDAEIIGRDPGSDLAVIKAKGVSGWTPATLGSSGNLVVGQTVVAVGSPLGLSGTVTSGIVSALNRPVTTNDSSDGSGQSSSSGSGAVLNAIQTDAAINPGNSGGPLVDLNGRVVGINSAIASLGASAGSSQSGSIGLGFSIPIDQAKRIADELISTGKATHPQLGVSVKDGANGGAQIQQVTSGGAADKAGLQAGDVITAVNGKVVDSADALVADIRSSAPGATVTITYARGGQSSTVSASLGKATS